MLTEQLINLAELEDEIISKLDVHPGFLGVTFYDISSLLRDNLLCRKMVNAFYQNLQYLEPDIIVGPESRGFLFLPWLASHFTGRGISSAMVRKIKNEKTKLPGELYKKSYGSEYEGGNTLCIQKSIFDHLKVGKPKTWKPRVVGLDDLIATGHSMKTVAELVSEAGGEYVATATIVEISFLNSRELLKQHGKLVTLAKV